jgi:hypothetical protein
MRVKLSQKCKEERDANSAINIMKLTKLWIEKQERPCEFKKTNSSFTILKKSEMEKS